MSENIPPESKLKDLKISDIRDLYKKSFPGSPTGGAGITKDYLISQLVNTSQGHSRENVPANLETKSDAENVKAHYMEEMGEDVYSKVNMALGDMPNLKGFKVSLWGDINIEPWQEYNREMVLVEDSSHEGTKASSDKDIIERFQDRTNNFFAENMSNFANRYTTITWVLAYLGYKLATTAIVSIIDDWKLLLPIKNGFTVEAIIRAKTPDIASKIYDYIMGDILNEDKIVRGRLYSEKNHFNVRLLERSVTIGYVLGVRKAMENLPSTNVHKKKFVTAAYTLVRKSHLKAFKEILPYLNDFTVNNIIRNADSNIVRYINDQRPYLSKSKK